MNKFCIAQSVRNASEGLDRMLWMLALEGEAQDSRNGKVVAAPCPCTIRVRFPTQRVVFDAERDANPFFHLMESIWMLAGSNSVDFVRQFNKNIASYSDDGATFNAAYGHRWRNHFGYDQLSRAIDMLTANPLDRRVVISMWDPYEDLGAQSKDIPCNQQIMFRKRGPYLDMSTTNRSNDLVWGLFGANCVHLTVVMEFVAAALGLLPGEWTHFTNNLHVYERHFPLLERAKRHSRGSTLPPNYEDYHNYPQSTMEVKDWRKFLAECELLVHNNEPGVVQFSEPFLENVVDVVHDAWNTYKEGDIDGALELCEYIHADDWRLACTQWLQRRKDKKV